MLLENRVTFLQRLQDAARNGYEYYVSGEIDVHKWLVFESKMDGAYNTGMPKSTRSKRKRAGEAVTLLYGFEQQFEKAGTIYWVMVVSEGKGRVHGREQLKSLQQERIEVGGFELVHDGVTWSWKMTRVRYAYWRDRVHTVAAKRPEHRKTGTDHYHEEIDIEIEDIMDILYGQPGFRLVRRQIGLLVSYAKSEWTRLRPANGPQIRERSFLPYLRRLPNRSKREAEVEVAEVVEVKKTISSPSFPAKARKSKPGENGTKTAERDFEATWDALNNVLAEEEGSASELSWMFDGTEDFWEGLDGMVGVPDEEVQDASVSPSPEAESVGNDARDA